MLRLSHLARTIIRSQWEPKPYVKANDVSADALTNGLSTRGDTLSLWECTKKKSDIFDIVLAIASSRKSLEPMHIVLIRNTDLKADGITSKIAPEHAITPLDELKSRHFNLVNLTMTQLCSLAKRIDAKVQQNSNDLYEFTYHEVLGLLCDAVKSERLELDELVNNIRAAVEKELKKERK